MKTLLTFLNNGFNFHSVRYSNIFSPEILRGNITTLLTRNIFMWKGKLFQAIKLIDHKHSRLETLKLFIT